MKLLIIFFAMVLSAIAEPSEEPSDLTLLRNNWITSKAIAIKPIDEKYAVSLSAMRDKYTKAGNLEAAIFVDNELKALLGKAPLLPQISREPSSLTKDAKSNLKDMKTKLIGTTWAWFGGENITFQQDDKAMWSVNNNAFFTWKIVDEKERIISGLHANGNEYKITFSSTFTKGKVLENNEVRDTVLIRRTREK